MTEQKTITEMSSEELGLALGQLFEQAFQVQQSIYAITTELQHRKIVNEDTAKDAN